jgi:hypothetical protein
MTAYFNELALEWDGLVTSKAYGRRGDLNSCLPGVYLSDAPLICGLTFLLSQQHTRTEKEILGFCLPDDEIMNLRGRNERTCIVDTHCLVGFPNLKNPTKEEMKRVGMQSDLFIRPTNIHGNHWILVVYYKPKDKFFVYDSGAGVLKTIKSDEYVDKIMILSTVLEVCYGMEILDFKSSKYVLILKKGECIQESSSVNEAGRIEPLLYCEDANLIQ